MIWLVPAALAGFVLVAGPLALHLLTRHQARRLPFPTIRFVQPSNTAAVRLQRPTDVWLMLLRIAAVACAVAAAAQPLVLSRWRVSTWNARVARVVVVDTSPSMQQPDARARIPSALAAEIARAEQVSAYQFAQIDTEDLNDGLSRAVRMLATSPPARREIVLVSDFHQGTVSSRSLGEAPPDIGLRFVRAGDLPDTREWTGPALSGWRHARWQPNVAIDSASTRVRWQSTGASPASSPITIATAEGEQADGRAALAAAATIGRPESDGDGRTVVQFAGAAAPAGFDRAHEIRSPRNASILLSLRANPALDQAARSEEVTSAVAADAPWLAVTRDPSGRALVAAAESDERLLIRTSAHARSVFAPALIRALMLASGGQQAVDREVIRTTDAELARWSRQPDSVTGDAWLRSDQATPAGCGRPLWSSWWSNGGFADGSASRGREEVNAEAA